MNIKIAFLFLVSIILLLFSCEKQKNIDIVSAYNIEQMTSIHLPDYSKKGKYNIDKIDTNYIYYNEHDSTTVNIILGIHGVKENAESAAMSYMQEISVRHNDEGLDNYELGDKYWWLSETNDTEDIIRIVFVRYNILIAIQSFDIDIKALAKEIDDDILNRESYITFK